ncbi:MAG TPA: protein kinase [Thermoanaerobaculia bacterium]|nr:protein kinase [Thermoanaerobaculia bacterium]
MNLAAGCRLGPYEVLSPLGAGGMGEVYRARDTRLGREVAVKVLPEDLARDPERLRRFEGEARAASALTDPHIVAVYDVGEEDSVHFFASELVDGSDLRRLIDAGPVPLKKALDLAEQIASGLAAAHEKGIIHRDLKPENVLITKTGIAKIADFGLAKLTESTARDVSQLPTTDGHQTTAGVVMGTVAYMSPEQAQGKAVDFRTDQFSFGTVLYEMLTGRRPFAGASPPETLTAVIREEPEPLEKAAPAVPAPVRWIVERCLAKDSAERFSSTSDLAKELQDLRSHLSEAIRAPAVAPAETRRSRRRLPLPAAVALAAASVGAGYFAAGRRTSNAPPSFRALTFRRGTITGARFGPDGKSVYYSAAYGSEPSRVFVTRIDGTESAPLDLPPAILLSVSQKNELAVLLTNERNPHNSHGTLARVAALGGTPRPLATDAIDADWAPDGEQMLLSRGASQIEFPLGHPLALRGQDPRFSPAGDHIAFAGRDERGAQVEQITDVGGKIVTSHPIEWQFGKAWTPDGKELWFTGSESGAGYDRALYALSLTGKLRLVLRAPVALTVWDVGSDRRALLSPGAAWLGIAAGRAGSPKEQPLDLLGRTFPIALSADGRWVLAWERREVGGGAYLRSTDGAQTLHLGSDEPLGLSPDGAWVLTSSKADPLRLIPIGPGLPRQIPTSGLGRPPGGAIAGSARWSRDGRRLFLSQRDPAAGATPDSRIYVRDGDRPWRPITPGGIAGRFAVSPDGRKLAIRDGSGVLTVYPVDGGASVSFAGETGTPILWSPDGRWLYLQTSTLALASRVYRREIATGRVEPWNEVSPADLTGVSMIGEVLLSDDAQSYVYRYARLSNELYLAEGLR